MSAESPLRFIDTNILAYAHDRRSGRKHEIARQLVDELWLDKAGCLSIQVLQEFYVIVTRKIAAPIGPMDAERVVRDLSQWHVHTPRASDVLNAIEMHQRHQISYWDATIIGSAARLGCSILLTEDLNSGQIYDGVQVLNPFI